MINLPSGTYLVTKVDGNDNFTEEVLSSEDISTLGGALYSEVVLLESSQSISGEKTFIDDSTFSGNVNVSLLVLPVSANSVDLGTDSLDFKDLWAARVAHSGAALNLATLTSDSVNLITNNSIKWSVNSAGTLIPNISGSYSIGSTSLPAATVYANEFISEGSPGIKITHENGVGIIDTTEDNDLRIRRNGTPILHIEGNQVLVTTDLSVEGEITATSGTTILTAEQLLIEDNIITLNSTTTGTPVLDAGIEVERGDSTNARLIWDESEDSWIAGISGSEETIILQSVFDALDSSVVKLTGDQTVSGVKTFANDVITESWTIDGREMICVSGQNWIIRTAANNGAGTIGGGSTATESTGARISVFGNGGTNADQCRIHAGSTTPGHIGLYIGATERWRVGSDNHFVPIANNSYDIGSASANVREVHATKLTSFGDITLTAGGADGDISLNSVGTGDVLLNSNRHITLTSVADINLTATDDIIIDAADSMILDYVTSFVIRSNGTDVWEMAAAGDLMPGADDTYDIGSTSIRISKVWTTHFDADTSIVGGDFAANGATNGKEMNSVQGFQMDSSRTSTGTVNHHRFYNPNGLVGSITTNGTATAFNTSSDYRLKENIVSISGGIDRVKLLNPCRFNFLSDPNTTVDGFLAHEVSPYVPEAITGEHDGEESIGNYIDPEDEILYSGIPQPEVIEEGYSWVQTGTRPLYQAIDQSKLVPLLTAALKEAISLIEDLESRVSDLESP